MTGMVFKTLIFNIDDNEPNKLENSLRYDLVTNSLNKN